MAAGNPSFELRRRALGDDLAVVKDGNPVSQLVGLLEVLGGEEEQAEDRALGDRHVDAIEHDRAIERLRHAGGLDRR
jgi:hypothetical protein